MKYQSLSNNSKPSFCWDRNLTVLQIKEQLSLYSGTKKNLLCAWILREAPLNEVWTFFTPSEISAHLNEISAYLGRRKLFWEYLLNEWHGLGKI